MPAKPKRRAQSDPERDTGSAPLRAFAVMAEAGSRCYVRARDLPKLIPLWPHEIEDPSREASLQIVGKLRRALRAERNLGRAGHWSYDLNRHLALLGAYRAELSSICLPGSRRAAITRRRESE